jgi:predicted RND superfamily exporter protein
MGVETTESRSYTDQVAIESVFGKEQPLLLMVPRDGVARELKLGEALGDIPHVTQVISYAGVVGTTIPSAYAPEEARNQFYSDAYARIILYTNLETEGDLTFETIDQILSTTDSFYSEYYLTGESAALYDMKNVVAVDMGRINLIAVIGIFIVLMFTFKSLTIPLFLIFTIESAIWMNLSIPYFASLPISFIGYLIISTVQLGATVDYAILMTHKYIDERQKESKKEAMWNALKNNVAAVLISASILATAGFTLAGTTNNPVIKELGSLLGRGTVLSFVMVVAVLPALLLTFDKLIQKTTLSHGFYQETEDK